MNVLLVIFAMLDFLLFVRFSNDIYFPKWSLFLEGFNCLQVLSSLFLISLLFSVYGIFLKCRWWFILTYIQFPFRLAFLYLSFGFLTYIVMFINNPSFYKPMLYFAVVLEFIRIIVTILIHRKQRTKTNF